MANRFADVVRPANRRFGGAGPGMWSMRSLPIYGLTAALVLAVAASGCGDGDEEPAFEVRGLVVAGPTCPVQRDPPDPACDDRPVEAAAIRIKRPDGRVVVTARSVADGSFVVTLPAGRYRFEPQPVQGLMGTAAAVDVDVHADGTVSGSLRFVYDTGIR